MFIKYILHIIILEIDLLPNTYTLEELYFSLCLVKYILLFTVIYIKLRSNLQVQKSGPKSKNLAPVVTHYAVLAQWLFDKNISDFTQKKFLSV